MSKKSIAPLPKPLEYLQPFVRFLSKYKQDEMNEDVDPSMLIAILQKRIERLDFAAAEAKLNADFELFKTWMDASAGTTHPAFWIYGFVSYPGFVKNLMRPVEPKPVPPAIEIELPTGWTVKLFPNNIHFKVKKIKSFIGGIQALDETSFKRIREVKAGEKKRFDDGSTERMNQEHSRRLGIPAPKHVREEKEVTFGPVFGTKYINQLILPSEYRSIHYLLLVPGGYADVVLGQKGTNLREEELEAKLHTLRLIRRKT